MPRACQFTGPIYVARREAHATDERTPSLMDNVGSNDPWPPPWGKHYSTEMKNGPVSQSQNELIRPAGSSASSDISVLSFAGHRFCHPRHVHPRTCSSRSARPPARRGGIGRHPRQDTEGGVLAASRAGFDMSRCRRPPGEDCEDKQCT